MPVRYIRVNPVSDIFSPAIRAYGNIAVVGAVTPPAMPPADLLAVNAPTIFTDPSEAKRRAPGALGTAIALAFAQAPGPTVIQGVRVDSTNWEIALAALETQDVQIVLLANTSLDATTGATTGAVRKLVDHVVGTSTIGADGMERIGVAMLDSGVSSPALVAGALANERMVYIAHKSTEDVAAAVAGTIAGYEPHISMLLKKVNVSTASFSAAEIQTLNGSETFQSGPAGLGVNWLVDPVLLPGAGVYLGEGYTGDSGGTKKYIDIVRCIDNVSFLLKSQLIRSVGTVRVSRSGLRALIAQMEAVLDPLVRAEVIEGYEVVVPILALLDKPPNTLTAAELAQVSKAQNDRVVRVLAAVVYAGAIHRLSVTLKFE